MMDYNYNYKTDTQMDPQGEEQNHKTYVQNPNFS